MFYADREADGVGKNPARLQLLCGELGMGCARGMNGERFCIGDVGEIGKEF